jgi:NAD(P)-dependent dehydrogenase (short-subunit alcohol dehydrogenase family)
MARVADKVALITGAAAGIGRAAALALAREGDGRRTGDRRRALGTLTTNPQARAKFLRRRVQSDSLDLGGQSIEVV